MARRTRRAAKKRLLKKILAPLLTLLAAALTGYSVWDYTGGASLPAAAMPEGALVSVQVIDVGQGSSLLLPHPRSPFGSHRRGGAGGQ